MYQPISGPITASDAQTDDAPLFEASQRKRVDTVAEQPVKRQRAVRIRLTYHGVMIEFAYSAEDSVPIHEIEQSIDTMLRREGWAGMLQPAASANGSNGVKPSTLWVDPEYDSNGDPCCPVHRKPLKQGTYGSYCSSRAAAGDATNDKGYCSLKFKE